jgi:hypothetical protein
MNVESKIHLGRPAILDVARIREDFPILRQKVRGKDRCSWTAPRPHKSRAS